LACFLSWRLAERPSGQDGLFLLGQQPTIAVVVAEMTGVAGLVCFKWEKKWKQLLWLSGFRAGRLFSLQRAPAGSAQTLLWGIQQVAKRDLLPLSSAWDLASTHPQAFLQKSQPTGLREGAQADLVLFTWNGGT
jgi:hypothetical protein